MFRHGLVLLLAILALPAAAEIYKWTDAQGKVHYGDQPPFWLFAPGTFTALLLSDTFTVKSETKLR